MNGCGNDFIIIDARNKICHPSIDEIKLIAARDNYNTKGCDQVAVFKYSASSPETSVKFFNADGGEIDICGNALRCISALEDKSYNSIKTNIGTYLTKKIGEYHHVNMGKALTISILNCIYHINIGNPHAIRLFSIYQSEDERISVATSLYNDFGGNSNVSVVCRNSDGTVAITTYERGAGLTKSCGTAACAALLACESEYGDNDITFTNGLRAYFGKDGIWLTGATEREFEGQVVIYNSSDRSRGMVK